MTGWGLSPDNGIKAESQRLEALLCEAQSDIGGPEMGFEEITTRFLQRDFWPGINHGLLIICS